MTDWYLQGEPRPAQIEALRRSLEGVRVLDAKDAEPIREQLPHYPNVARGWGHMMQMRVGKTPTLLNEMAHLLLHEDLEVAVVLAPNKFKHTWESEHIRFGAPLDPFVFESASRKAFAALENRTGWVLYINYEALRSDDTYGLVHMILKGRKYLIAADESVMIKSRTSIQYKRARALALKAHWIRAMSGKPTPQNIGDWWSQANFMGLWEKGYSFFRFRGQFAKMGGFKGKQIIGIREDRMEQWYELRDNQAFFAKRKDWATAIDSDYEKIKLEGQPTKLTKAYDEMERHFMIWLEEEQHSVNETLTQHMKLQQISSGWMYDEHRNDVEVYPFEKTPKYTDLKDRLVNQLQCKVMIVAHFKPTIMRLFRHLNADGFRPALMVGGTLMNLYGRNTEEEKRRFNNDPKCRVVVINKACKYGHTLMGTVEDPCEAIVFFENSYNLDDRAQLEERPQGEGQASPIHIMDYISTPIEDKVVDALVRKEEISRVIERHYR